MPTTLRGRYRLDEMIGGGGMGEVWRAHDNVLDRNVAVKVIRSHLADSETVRARLRVEARLAGSLHHPGIVNVFDYGEHEAEGRTVPFVVMPLIEGEPLSRLLRGSATLPAGQTMAIVAEVAEALQASHSAGIIHRDLKPGNILLSRSGRVMLVDFGIARAADGEPLTETGALLGTVDYLSPEQCAGRTASAASDLYGLGVVAYSCLSGTLPFRRDSDIATALAHLNDEPPALSEDIPLPARELVGRLLARDPADRPASAAQVAAAARALATSLPSVAGLERDPSPRSGTVQPTGVLPRDLPATGATGALGTEALDAQTMETQALDTQAPDTQVLDTQALGTGLLPRGAPTRRPGRRAVLVGAAAIFAIAAAIVFLSTRGPAQVEVPTVKGQTVSAASAELTGSGLRVKTTKVDAVNKKAGSVVGQEPAAGTSVDEHTIVTVSVASGQVRIPETELLGASYDTAASRLKELGLIADRVDTTSSKAAGTVIAVDPSGRAESGGTVRLTVARAAVVTPPTDNSTNNKSRGKGKKHK